MTTWLEKLACRFLIRKIEDAYGSGCSTKSDWVDGEILEEHGCWSCKANFTIKFLKEHITLL